MLDLNVGFGLRIHFIILGSKLISIKISNMNSKTKLAVGMQAIKYNSDISSWGLCRLLYKRHRFIFSSMCESLSNLCSKLYLWTLHHKMLNRGPHTKLATQLLTH